MKVKREIIYAAGFLLSIPVALTAYINSSYLGLYINAYYVSAVYALASALTIWALLEMPRFLTRYGNRRITFYCSLLILLSLLLLAVGQSPWIIVPAFILFFAGYTLAFISLDIFMEDFSLRSSIGGMRGFYLVVVNSSWVIAQMMSGSVLAKSSYTGIYLLSAVFVFLMSMLFVLFLGNFVDPEYKKVSVRKTVAFFWAQRDMLKIYIINVILKFFYAWMIIYTPIYLHQEIGFSWQQIAVVFTIMLLPFVIIEFPLGIWSDKMGERKMLAWGFLVGAVFTAIIPYITKPEVAVWATVLFITRVGAATIEVMSESYFFKSVSAENADAISFFRNTYPISFIIAPLSAIPILFFVPHFYYLFYVLSAVLLFGLFLTLRLRDIK